MHVIPRTFFITGMGRSGTAFLASVLDRGSSHRVVHEWKLPKSSLRDGRLRHFPLWRFRLARYPFPALRKGYGEVNSHLRRTVDPVTVGLEARVERRGLILRDPRAIIRSGMNRKGRTEADFEALCASTLRWAEHIQRLRRHPHLVYEPFAFERMTRDPGYVQGIAAWAGIEGLDVPPDLLETKVNQSGTDWFPRWGQWEPAWEDAFWKALRAHPLTHAYVEDLDAGRTA